MPALMYLRSLSHSGTPSRVRTELASSDRHESRSLQSDAFEQIAQADLHEVHAKSKRAAQFLELLSRFGVMPMPLIIDSTASRDAVSTLEMALAALRNSTTLAISFRWAENESVWYKFAHGVSEDGEPFTPDAEIAHLRDLVGSIRVIWLLEAHPAEWVANDLLQDAFEGLDDFLNAMQRFESQDPSLGIVSGETIPEFTGGDDADRRDAENIKILYMEAVAQASLDGDATGALRLLIALHAFTSSRAPQIDGPLKSWFESTAARILSLSVGLEATPDETLAKLRLSQPDAASARSRLMIAASWPWPLEVPGDDLEPKTSEDGLEIFVEVHDPSDPVELQAPWLYALTFHVDAGAHDELDYTNVLVRLVQRKTSKQFIRPVRRTYDNVFVATFNNLEPGSYLVEPVSETEGANFASRPEHWSQRLSAALKATFLNLRGVSSRHRLTMFLAAA